MTTGLPRHVYRDAAILHGVLGGLIVLISVFTGTGVLRGLGIAVAYAAAAITWSWWRLRQRERQSTSRRGDT